MIENNENLPEKKDDEISADDDVKLEASVDDIDVQNSEKSENTSDYEAKKAQPNESRKKSKSVSIGFLVVCVLLAILASTMTTYVVMRDSMTTKARLEEGEKANSDIEKLKSRLEELDKRFKSVYIGDIDYDTVGDMMLYGYLAGTGDKYAYYYTAEDYKALTDQSTGNSQGIGVSVIYNAENGLIEVISVYPDSSAEKAGIKVGDLIAYVGKDENRASVAEIGYDNAVNLIRGEAGTVVDITVLRGSDYEAIDFSMERGYFSDQTVLYHLYEPDNSVGVIKITQFLQITPVQFMEAKSQLEAQGAKKLIVDLRYNGGGDKDAICEILDSLLPEGPILRIKESGGDIVTIAESDADYDDIPLVVVVNGSTASAAELFTAAMRDYGRAKIVGETTYGKGCMQTFLPLSDGSYFKVTSAMYYPPYSDNYDGIGITPDVEVALDEALQSKNIYKITDEEDNQLEEAYKLIK